MAPDYDELRNLLLLTLGREDYAQLSSNIETVELAFKQILCENNEPISHVYFPETGVMSMLTSMENGDAVEVGTVGKDGLIGLPLFLGAVSNSGYAFAQIPGRALRVRATAFREEVGRGGLLHALLNRYAQVLFDQMAQMAACNRLHPIEERCARWLLVTQDRVGADEFVLTQEFLSQMLGVRRATVNVAAGMLQKAGFIQFSRGLITVIDRAGLLGSSCECYNAINSSYERLIYPLKR